MPALLQLRPLTRDEIHELQRLAHSQKGEARLRERARICWRSHEGHCVREIVTHLRLNEKTVRRWITRFNAHGLAGLTDAPRIGRPPTYTTAEVGVVVATSLTPPDTLGLPFGSWTLDRLVTYLTEVEGITMRRSRIANVLQAEGLRWRTQETWFGERVDPAFAAKKGAIVALYEQPPPGSVVICLDEMGPEAAKSHAGTRLCRHDPTGERRVRARQEIDYGRRGKGYIFGAFEPATGQAFTAPYGGRTIATWVDFLERVDAWVDPAANRVYAILDNLSTHRAVDVLLWSLAHPRWAWLSSSQPTRPIST